MNPASSTVASVAAPVSTTVLVVEDEEPLRDLITSVLTAAQFRVLAASDGSHALRLLKNEHVDVVLTDLCMPDSDGMEVLTQLRMRKSSIPVIVMSGGVHGRIDYLLKMAESLGAKRTLAKPFSLPALVGVVRSVLPTPQVS